MVVDLIHRDSRIGRRIRGARIPPTVAAAFTVDQPQVLARRADTYAMTVATLSTEQAASLDELSRVLWTQRELIDVLQYRLEVQRLMLIASRPDRLSMALSEVESAMAAIREVETARDAIVRRCAEFLGLAPNATITQLRNAAPEPWHTLLAEHQEALLAQVAETERLAATNRELSARGVADMREVLNEITGTAPTVAYGPDGSRAQGGGLARPALVDREV